MAAAIFSDVIMLNRVQTVASPFLALVAPFLLLLLWMGLAARIGNQVILPTAGQVAELILQPTQDVISMGSLLDNVVVSLVRVLLGYLLAVMVAIPLGVFMGYYATVYKMLNNVLNLFRPIPPLAWVPLIMAWFGVSSLATLFGVEMGNAYIYLNNLKFSMMFIIFIGAFYPILTATIHGVTGVNKTLLDSARVLGANQRQMFLKVILPAALPTIVTGLRIGLGIAWMCLVSAEMLPGSLAGVGYLITHAYTLASTDIVIAGMISIGGVGALMDTLFRVYAQKKFTWQKQAS